MAVLLLGWMQLITLCCDVTTTVSGSSHCPLFSLLTHSLLEHTHFSGILGLMSPFMTHPLFLYYLLNGLKPLHAFVNMVKKIGQMNALHEYVNYA